MWKKKKSGFPGGIHPTDGYDKAMTMNLPVREYWPETVTILTEQSFGGKCSLLVKPGDKVIKGSHIGKPEAFMAASLHASVSGEVLDVKEVRQQNRMVLSCIIKNEEGNRREAQKYETEMVSLEAYSKEVILAGIRDGGLTGMGGAGFPSHKKYETDKSNDSLLINGAGCEPFLTCDYRLMLEQGYGILNGICLLLKASGAKKAYLCIEDNKPEAISSLRRILEAAKQSGKIEETKKLEIRELPAKYPQGGERQLIQAVNLGAKIAESEFLSQFEGAEAPVYLPGMSLEEKEEISLEDMTLADGDYGAKADGPDNNGFTDQVTMTVKDGKITAVNWESVGEDGSKKSVLSENGECVMTEDGLTWKEQAKALSAALIENQSLSFLNVNEQGKTDAVSGVSIAVSGFVNLAEQCLNQAAGAETETQEPQNGTQVDAVAGATISSTAAVEGINAAYEFLQSVK